MWFQKRKPIIRRAPGTSITASPTRKARALAALLCAACLSPVAAADRAAAQETGFSLSTDRDALRRVSGMLMLDYSSLTLSNGGDFDLISLHYLQQVNDWLSYGAGAFAPMVEGNYGGFFGADLTVHAQRQIYGNWFVNGGLAFGVGAGGQSLGQSRTLSGDGVFGRVYAGIGYQARRFSFGVNYSRVAILNSQINDATLSFFVQRPLHFSVGRYTDAGRIVSADTPGLPEHENILSFQANNFVQINPTGRYTGDIGNASVQFTHFLNRDVYTFVAADLGATGVPLYNQAHAGFGRRFALTRNVNLYAQLGLGSSGWATNTVDTGPGFFIYPKATLEYLWRNGLGLTLAAGYMHAPLGTSRNWTVGVGLNYHLSHGEDEPNSDYTLHGMRLNVLGRRTSRVSYNGRRSEPLNLIAVQADYVLNDHWYLTGQIAAAGNTFRSYAGYAEAYAGIGWQSRMYASGRLQAYAQLMYGINPVGIDPAHEVGGLLYPALGMFYHVNDRLSIYSQLGSVVSTGQYLSGLNNSFRHTSLGFGVTYRFALPTRS